MNATSCMSMASITFTLIRTLIGSAISPQKFPWTGASTINYSISSSNSAQAGASASSALSAFATGSTLSSVPSTQDPPFSPMLHDTLMALAAAYSNPCIPDFKSRQYFVQAAKSYIDKEYQNSNMSTIHALSILGRFYASQGDQTLGYIYFGGLIVLVCQVQSDGESPHYNWSSSYGAKKWECLLSPKRAQDNGIPPKTKSY